MEARREMQTDIPQLDRAAFAQLPTVAEKFAHVLSYAVLAPSSFNSQPWRFELVGDTLELHGDRARSIPALDRYDRELTIACGAALYLLRIALRHFGYAENIEELPDRRQPNVLARVTLGDAREPTERDERRFAAITKRHTHREDFAPQDLPMCLIGRMRDLAVHERAWLTIVNDDAREDVVELIAEADRRRGHDPAMRTAVARWLRGRFSGSEDGVPVSFFGLGRLVSFAGPLFVRMRDWSERQADQDAQRAWVAPTLAVLSTSGDEPRDWLAAGEALAGILLEATAANVTASFLNQPIEDLQLRERLTEAIENRGFPQLMLRLGYSEPGPATPRRAVREVLAVE